MESEIIESIRGKAMEICKQPVSEDQPLWSTNLLDSLGRVELAFFVSDLTGVEIEPAEVCVQNFESVKHILSFLSRKSPVRL